MFNKISLLFSLITFCICTEVYSQSLQWRNLTNSPFYNNGRMEDIYFLNANTGWAVHYSGRAFRTTDGGSNWDTVFKFQGPRLFRSVGFFDFQTGIIGTLWDDTLLYRTTNGGTNWKPITNIPNPVPTGICGISVVNENVAYACGTYESPGRIIKTTDMGSTWMSLQIDTSLAEALVDCYFWAPDSGIVVGSNEPAFGTPPPSAVILLTSDGGSTWQKVFTSSRTNEWSWKICFVSRMVGYVSIQRYSFGLANIIKTTNGGYNWTEIPFAQYDVQGIGFVNENTGWVGGWTGPTYETTNGGSNWHLAGWGENVNRFRFINDTVAYAVGERVYKYSRETVGINLTSTETPSSFYLYQNYPNPFNPSTKIKFEITRDVRRETQDVRLIIYDALGKEVVTLVNENLSPGSYEAEFNSIGFSSGIYFYKLEIRNGQAENFSEVKRMILLR